MLKHNAASSVGAALFCSKANWPLLRAGGAAIRNSQMLLSKICLIQRFLSACIPSRLIVEAVRIEQEIIEVHG